MEIELVNEKKNIIIIITTRRKEGNNKEDPGYDVLRYKFPYPSRNNSCVKKRRWTRVAEYEATTDQISDFFRVFFLFLFLFSNAVIIQHGLPQEKEILFSGNEPLCLQTSDLFSQYRIGKVKSICSRKESLFIAYATHWVDCWGYFIPHR